MAKTISELKAQSAEVKNASAIGENTATRVGQLFGDIVEHVEQYENTKDGKDASQDAQMQSLVSAEESRAKGEERGLQNQIHAEKIDRQTADTYLGNLIQQESSARETADENIRTALANETARAQAAEQELAAAQIYTSKIKDGAVTTPKIADGAVTYEKTDIIAQELGTNMTKVPSQKVVTDAIQKEETERKADINGLTTALASETIQREQGDENLNAAIEAEINGLTTALASETIQREQGDENLNKAIVEEIARAKAAEEANTQAIAKRGIYDVSAYNDGAVFESLSALLNNPNLSTLIPTSVRHGGMTIRFIQGSEQNSDNKYVQARLIAQSFTTNITKWQSVDEEPKVGSHNLVESGGVLIKNNVLHYTSTTDSEIWGDKLDISNIPNGTIIYFTIKHTYPLNKANRGFAIYDVTTSTTKLVDLTVGTISQFVKTDSISIIRLYIAATSQAGDVALFMGVDKELLIENVVELYSLSTLVKKGYLYKGYATPSTNPKVVSGEKVFYIATKQGNYGNFNNINVPFTYNTYILKYDGSSWSYDVVENIKYDSKFSSCYIVNQLIKELYVVKQPQEFTNALYIRQIVSGANGLWRISFNQVGSTTGSIPFDFDKETNGLIHVSKGGLEIYAILDWSAISNNSTFKFTDTDTVLRNEKNVEFSPTIKLVIKNYDNQIAQINNKNQRQDIRVFSLGLNAFIPIQYGYIKEDGNYRSNDNFYISDFIPVSEGNKVYFTGKYQIPSQLGAVWGYTDENYSNPIMLLGWTQAAFENEEITIPASVNFIKAWSKTDIQPILSFVNNSIIPELSEYNVTVKKDGTGDFISIVDAVYAVTDTSKPNNIHIYPGTYDMISEYFGNSDYTDSDSVGLKLPQNVNLIGHGKKGDVLITANFPSNIKYKTSRAFSPIYLGGKDNKLQNLTIECFNCRYPVHDQANAKENVNYKHEYIDVVLRHNGFDSGAIVTTESVTEENNDTSHRWGSCHALGQGTFKTATIICERCEFICNAISSYGVPYLTHDAKEHLEQGVTILLSECKLVSVRNGEIINIASLGEGYNNSMTLRNCKFIGTNKSIVGRISTSGYNTEFVYTIYGNKENGVTITLPTGYEDNDWTI